MSPVEYIAKANWLRTQTTVTEQVRTVRAELKATEREIRFELDMTLEEWLATASDLINPDGLPTHLGFVAFWYNRPGQPLASRCVHADRHCQYLDGMGDEYIREATPAELQKYGRCLVCG